MTNEMKSELKYLLELCPVAVEVYAGGEFNNLKTEPYVYMFVNTDDEYLLGEYTYAVTNYLFDKYESWEKFPGITALVFSNYNSESVKNRDGMQLVYSGGRWLI